MAGVRDRIADALGGDDPDPQWADRVQDLLYDGESVRERVAVDDAQVVVTSHRVLAFTPDGDGPNFRQVERPNVAGVSTGATASGALLGRGVRWTAIGLVLLGFGTVVDFGAIVGDVDLSTGGTGAVGLGGVLGAVQGMLDLLRQLDAILQTLGALVVLLGVLVLGAYLRTRTPTLVVEVAGDADDVHLPRPDDPAATVDRLDAAIFPDDRTTAGGPDRDQHREA